MKIAILGTRGIPNQYGGFEQFADFVSRRLVEMGHQVSVYNSHNHMYQENVYEGVEIIHKYDPEFKLGTAGQFLYDLNCIIDSRKRKFDIILQLGYTSSSIWGYFLPSSSIILTNMDGLEWKRSKFNRITQKFLSFAEKLAVKTSDYLISDSLGIQDYIFRKYKLNSTYIAYGSDIYDNPLQSYLSEFNLSMFEYDMLVARLEPENNIEMILEGYTQSSMQRPFLVIGKHNSKYGEFLKKRFEKNSNIFFLGGIYDQDKLSTLRYFSNLYFHGHTVGGTNPSLLEAMGCSCLIVAHDNVFNKSILESNGFYFKNAEKVSSIIDDVDKKSYSSYIKNNVDKIQKEFTWDVISKKYEELMLRSLSSNLG